MDMEALWARTLPTLEKKLDPGHTALLVIDMQNDYCSPGGAGARKGRDLSSAQLIIPRVARLTAAARDAKAPVIYVLFTVDSEGYCYSGPELERRAGRWGDPEVTVKGTWGHAVVSELTPKPGDLVVEKHRSSAFVGTDLALVLRSAGIRTVVATGVVTHGCVESTVRDAVAHDFYAVVARDCVASPEPERHQRALQTMAEHLHYEDAVTDSERIMEIWARGAGARKGALATSAAPGTS